jgi:hypothetical protein
MGSSAAPDEVRGITVSKRGMALTFFVQRESFLLYQKRSVLAIGAGFYGRLGV